MDVENLFYNYIEDIKEFEKTYLTEINKNARAMIKFLSDSKNSKNILLDPRQLNGCLSLINHYMKVNNLVEEFFDVFLEMINFYSNQETCNKYNLFSSIFRQIFEKLAKDSNINNNMRGFKLFHRISMFFEPNKFNNSKAYCVYFAYQIKNYKQIEFLLNTIYNEPRYDYKDWRDFYLFNFYKGLIFISLKDFSNASVSFLMNLTSSLLDGYSFFQVESVKRLLILNYLIDGQLRNVVFSQINLFKNLLLIKPVEPYNELNRLFSSKFHYKVTETLIKEMSSRLKADRTHGLVKECFRKLVNNRICDTLKNYSKIRLNKLSNMLEIEPDTILLTLKKFSNENKIHVKYDEEMDVLEVTDTYFNEEFVLNKMKNYYSQMTSIGRELVCLSFEKKVLAEKIKLRDNENLDMKLLLSESQGSNSQSKSVNKKNSVRGSNPDQGI